MDTNTDRRAIMTRAWELARRKQAYRFVQDWTPGINYGSSRAATAAEKRAVFADALREAWHIEKMEALRCQQRRMLSEIQRYELILLMNKDTRYSRTEAARLDILIRAA